MARTAVVAGTATAVSNRVSRRQAGRWAEQDQQAAYEQQQAYAQQQAAYAPPPQAYAPPPQAYAPPPPPPAYEQPPPAEPAPAEQPDMTAKLAQLQQLGELKAQGILTEAEFEAQKNKILAS
jgi:hypothetical protein